METLPQAGTQVQDEQATRRAKSHLGFWSKKPASAVGLAVAKLLDEWDGLHHFDETAMRKAAWDHPHWIELKVSSIRLSTYDFDALTRLVFLAHDYCIRIEVCPCNGTHFKLTFHPRKRPDIDDPTTSLESHPTLETAVQKWRSRHPAEVQS